MKIACVVVAVLVGLMNSIAESSDKDARVMVVVLG